MTMGLLEAVTAAIGEQLNELGGHRSTRLTNPWTAGSSTAFVESTFGWDPSGTFLVAGTTYAYTGKTPASFTGVTHDVEGTPVVGAKVSYVERTEIIDLSKAYSAIERTIQNFFVRTASGAALSTVGRNVGVSRPAGLEDDDVFRKVIQALAYSPKGTMFAIELALTAFFGAGNFEVWEDFPTYRNTVFIRIIAGLYLASTSTGQAYLTRQETATLNTGTKETTITGPVLTVQGVRLADEEKTTLFDVDKPSVELDVRYVGDAGVAVWKFSGTNEGTDVIASAADGGVTRILDQLAASTTTYLHTARVLPESDAYFELLLRPLTIPSAAGTSGNQFAMHLRDSVKDVAVGFFDAGGGMVDIGFISTASGSLLAGVAARIPAAQYKSVAIRKRGLDFAQLLVGNAVVQQLDRAAFDATVLNEFSFGCYSTTITGVEVRVKFASFFATTSTDFWNVRGTAGATVAPDTLDTNSALLVVGDVGKAVRTFGAATKKNNGSWLVASYVDSDNVTLVGTPRQLAIVESSFPTRVRIANEPRAFKYPDDIGKVIDLTAATTAPNPGSYVITAVLDPVLLTPLTGTSEDTSHVIEVAGASFVTETEIAWRLMPDFSADSPVSWELASAGVVSGTTLTLRAIPPLNIPVGYTVIVKPVYTQVLSAYLVAGPEVVNELLLGLFTEHPFYLPSNPLGPFAAFLDELTVAGVIPEVSL